MSRPATRVVNRDGAVHLARHRYPVGRWLAGETVEVVCGDSLVEVFHRDVLIVSHVARHQRDARIVKRKPFNAVAPKPRRRPGDTTPFVTRLVDARGAVSFAAAEYKVGADYRRRSVQLAVVDGAVVIALNGETIRTHPSVTSAARRTARSPTPTAGPAREPPLPDAHESVNQVPNPKCQAGGGT